MIYLYKVSLNYNASFDKYIFIQSKLMIYLYKVSLNYNASFDKYIINFKYKSIFVKKNLVKRQYSDG